MLEVCMSIIYIYIYMFLCIGVCMNVYVYMCLFVVMHAMPCHVYIACMHIIYIYMQNRPNQTSHESQKQAMRTGPLPVPNGVIFQFRLIPQSSLPAQRCFLCFGPAISLHVDIAGVRQSLARLHGSVNHADMDVEISVLGMMTIFCH